MLGLRATNRQVLLPRRHENTKVSRRIVSWLLYTSWYFES